MVSQILLAPHPWVLDGLPRALDERTGRVEDVKWPLELEVRRILSRRHGFDAADTDAVTMWDTSVESLMFGRMVQAMKNFFSVVGVVTLALGGLGVMNIMLVAVRERTREIGVRKALGATTAQIQRQFFLEGFVLTMLSGAVGFAVALAICALVNMAPMPTALPGNDSDLAGGRRRRAHAGVHRRGDVHVSRPARGAAAAGRGAAVRSMTSAHVLSEIAREAVFGLVRNRVRAGLSMLGISWGIVSVVMLLAYGEGFNAALLRGFKGAFGDGVTIMFAGQTSMQAGGERAGRRIRMRLADVETIAELPLVKAWSPEDMQTAADVVGHEAGQLPRARASRPTTA